MASLAQPRLYRGISAQQRRAERQTQIMNAAIEIFGEVGYRSASVKAICERAKLTERYFYESYENSEALLIAAYIHVTNELVGDMTTASQTCLQTDSSRLNAILRIYFTRIRDERLAAKVFLLELAGISPAVDEVRSKVLRSLNGLIANRKVRSVNNRGTQSLREAGVIGAILSISIRWLSQDCSTTLADVIEIAASHCTVGSHEASSTVAEGIPNNGKRKKGV